VQLVRFLTSTQSQAWAKAIVPQHPLLLKLSIEIQIKIWEEVIDTFKNEYKLVTPWKNGKKFKSHWWPTPQRNKRPLRDMPPDILSMLSEVGSYTNFSLSISLALR
jgi:hypothetical protein